MCIRAVIFVCIFLLTLQAGIGQTERFDIASFVPPVGWNRLDSNGVLAFYDAKSKEKLTTFCQIILYPSRKSADDAQTDFKTGWNDLVLPSGKITNAPVTKSQNTNDGWELVTGYAGVSVAGGSYTTMLITASGFGKAFHIMINVAGEDYSPAITAFLSHLTLDGKANTSALIRNAGYQFTPPDNWVVANQNGVQKFTRRYNSELACVLTIYPLRTMTGDVDTEVRKIFGQQYAGWRFYYSDQRKDEIRKGYTRQGLEYCMMEAAMVKDRVGVGWDYETGAVLLIKNGRQCAVVTIRHESTGIHCVCNQQYACWGRFFNSFTVENIDSSLTLSDDKSKRILGSWMASGNRAIGEYIFAANGRYQYIGGYGSMTEIDSRTIELKSSAFQGDGKYIINNDRIVLKRDGEKNEATYGFRIEKFNKGSTGWKERIVLLNLRPADGSDPYEVSYDRSSH